jgi:alkyl hydroperoxide reductase subunit AhpF
MNLLDAEVERSIQDCCDKDLAQQVTVEIYIANHCHICEYTFEVAEMIRQEYPQVELHIIDLMDPDKVIPPQVFATPTYLLNGSLWSLGNPSIEDMRTRLSRALGIGLSTAA